MLFGLKSLGVFMGGIYGEKGGFDVGEGAGGGRVGSVWSRILDVGKCIDRSGLDFSGSFRKVVGEGRDTRFWEDVWLGDRPLIEEFPRLRRLESSEGGETISEKGVWVCDNWGWRWSWKREPRGRELGELVRLERRLAGWEPRRGKADSWVWNLDVTRGFSVKKLRELLAGVGGGVVGGGETVWALFVPKKVNVFMWRLRLGRLPLRVSLDKMGVDLNSVLCPRCGDEAEDLDHALLKCKAVRTLWSKIGVWWNNGVSGIDSIS
ncbi:hypothetical protein OSB04_017174 [Centaurea solstitialis]|uniref:Reverse transcriptase zinc-binding domain-containing protein n=1 Tax=Centaurea solstitialis TaxID=347529 RepID=A0AA38WKG9_9ASTR|nr:hypothetical protein OSB04_017174 [Centaurea solstitialis]